MRELRVHGVGGPQGPKMLGVLHESDVFTEAPRTVDNFAVPRDSATRVVRRVEDPDQIVAYEWGGLTNSGASHPLWVVLFPLTLLNVAGWGHARTETEGRSSRVAAHATAVLGTLTYIVWTGYLLVDLIGVQWSERAQPGLPTWLGDAVRCAGRPLMYLVFIVAFVVLGWVIFNSAEPFEGCLADGPAASWADDANVVDRGFFAHGASYRRLARAHGALAVAALVIVGVLGAIHHGAGTLIGPAIFAVAIVQALVLTGWWLAAIWRGHVVQVAAATVGTALCHAAFAGAGQLVINRLAGVPHVAGELPWTPGPELALSNLFFLGLVIAVIGVVAIVATAALNGGGSPLVAGLVRNHATKLLTVVGLAFAAVVVGFAATQLGDVKFHGANLWRALIGWYDGFHGHESGIQKLGALALVALPTAVAAVIRSPSKGAIANVLANAWDVLTFWPRRFHPFGVPPYAERAVPELRAIIRDARIGGHVVVAGHSQGSVLSFAAIGAELQRDPTGVRVSFISFGSPIASLFAGFFPEHFDHDARLALASQITTNQGEWHNVWRRTDAISAPTTTTPPELANWSDHELPDPRQAINPDVAPLPPPLERARPWGVVNGHGFYLADSEMRAIRQALRQLT